jgi:hypothetical protein
VLPAIRTRTLLTLNLNDGETIFHMVFPCVFSFHLWTHSLHTVLVKGTQHKFFHMKGLEISFWRFMFYLILTNNFKIA